MNQTASDDVRAIDARPLNAGTAEALRTITTFFHLHEACPFKVCRRANACATRNVVCYQAVEDEMKPIVQSIVARRWVLAVAEGKDLDVPPAYQDDMRRRLAWEAIEIERIASGAYGDDDSLTYHQLWLKNFVARDRSTMA